MFKDSVDKIVTSYFATITKLPFTYKNTVYDPKRLYLSPLIYRGFTCPSHCGGCCPRFSLDYLPEEAKPNNTIPRLVRFNSKEYTIYTDAQEENESRYCQYLNQENGRCNNYETRPFTCDFELIRTLTYTDKHVLTQKLYGRGWAFTRIDGEKGALCEMTPPTRETVDEVIRKLGRLKEWADYFELYSWIDTIIKWVKSRSEYPMILDTNSMKSTLWTS